MHTTTTTVRTAQRQTVRSWLARQIRRLNAYIDSRPMPVHHRLGAWQARRLPGSEQNSQE